MVRNGGRTLTYLCQFLRVLFVELDSPLGLGIEGETCIREGKGEGREGEERGGEGRGGEGREGEGGTV